MRDRVIVWVRVRKRDNLSERERKSNCLYMCACMKERAN